MSASEASAMPRSPGLVSYATSDTPRADNKSPVPNDGPRIIDTKKARLGKMSRAVMKGAALHDLRLRDTYTTRNYAPIMATATYAKHVEPNPKHISYTLKLARQWAERKGFKLRYVWVAELTKKGKLHYHILFFLPPGKKLPMFDRAGWWKHGSTRLEWARNALQYIAKYASKGGGKGRHKFPKGFRLHGTGGLDKNERAERRYHLAPSWVRIYFTQEDKPKPMHGGGWLSTVTGDFQASPFYLVAVTAGRVVVGVKKWFTDYLRNQAEQAQQEQIA